MSLRLENNTNILKKEGHMHALAMRQRLLQNIRVFAKRKPLQTSLPNEIQHYMRKRYKRKDVIY